MATVTLRPNSDEMDTSDASHITKSTGSTFYGCVDESTLDTGDYLTYDATGGFWACFGFTDCGLTDETINSVTIYAYADNDYGCPHFTCNDVELWNTTQVSGKLYKYTLTKNGGKDWTASTVDSLKAGFAPSSDPDMKETTNLYQVYVVVDYTAASSSQNLTLTCAAGSYSLTGTNVTLTHTPASQNLTLACNAGTYSLTGTNADLTSARTLICESASGGAYPNIVVSGAGTSDANGTYVYGGKTFGKPYYTKGSELISWFGMGYDVWGIFVDGLSVYESTDDVATPDLVTTWTAVNDGSLPVPTVTAGAATTYVLTGSDVTLTYTQGAQNLTLTCEAGSYSLIGTDATLTAQYNYTLSCEAGSYSLTGTDVTLDPTFNYSLTCEAGSYTLTGSDVDFVLQRNYSFVCGAGSYALTGTDTTLEVKRNYVLECGVGSYTLTGTDITLTAQFHYSLVCEAGSYTYTGTDITFGNSKAYSLTCEAGAYTLTGSSVSFVIQRNYSLACETGSYTLTGTDADLVLLRNYILACEAGGYALTGTNAGLTSARTMACNAGSYTLTGTNADFYRALVMACEAGSYALTGTGVDFVKALIMALGEGSYALTGTGAGLNVYYAWVTTPACRTLVIVAENRVYAIPFENRTRTVDAENRTFTIKCCGG